MTIDTPATPAPPERSPDVVHHYLEKDGKRVKVGTSAVTLGEIHHFRNDNGNAVEIGMTKRGDNHAVIHSVATDGGYSELETEPYKEKFGNKQLTQVWQELNASFNTSNPGHSSNNSVAGSVSASDKLASQVEYPDPVDGTASFPVNDTCISALDRFKIAASSTPFVNIVPRSAREIRKAPQTAVITVTHYLESADGTSRKPIGSTTMGRNGEINHYGLDDGGDEFNLGVSEIKGDGTVSHQRWNENEDTLGFGTVSLNDTEMTLADCWRAANDPYKHSTRPDKAPILFDIMSDPRINIPPGQRIISEGDMTINEALEKVALSDRPRGDRSK